MLAERYGVSRGSVRATLADLVEVGRLVRAAGKGTFVAAPRVDAPVLLRATSRDIAFVISENIFRFVETGYNRILAGVEQVCRQRGLRLLFHSVGEEEAELHLTGSDGQEPPVVAGCIVTGGVRARTLDRLHAMSIPVVVADPLVAYDDQHCSIGFNYAQGTQDVVRYLYELGHREIGFIGFPNSEKYQSYWHALQEHDIPYNPNFVEFLELSDLEPSLLMGFRSMRKMIQRARIPTATLVTNDLVALGAMEALAMAGIRVPHEVSVVGFDDLVVDSTPPLTTVRVDSLELGRTAAQTLLRKINGDSSVESRVQVPVELVVRGSAAPPKKPVGIRRNNE
jgi:LacI family transcriptional regulator